MQRHSLLALLRFALAILVAYALPMSHSHWGPQNPVDGEEVFRFNPIFGMIGMAAAGVYFIVGTLAQIELRQRKPGYTVIADFALFTLFAGVLGYAGVHTTFSSAAP